MMLRASRSAPWPTACFCTRPLAATTSRPRRQFTGQITPDDPELRQLLQAWRQLEHERRKKVLEFSQDQLALSLLRVEKAILASVQTPEEAFEIVRDTFAWTAENGRPSGHSPAATRPSAKPKSGGGEAYGGS
jgi:hypothetical protein